VTRRGYIDWARAVAILVMIEAHILDSWTLQSVRRSVAFRDAQILGGFAAPFFLWLAGVSLVLSAASTQRRQGSRMAAVDAVCRRGLEVFVLAFLFRLQGFIITPGGSPVSLFRVDILNIMGPAIVAAAIVWGLVRRTDALVVSYAAIAAAFAMLTPTVRASPLVDRLPIWIQWHIRPSGDMTLFTAFPWAGFVFAGAAVGALLAVTEDAAAERRLQVWLAAAGAAVVAVGFYTASLPSIYSRSSFWTSSPTWFAIRLGVLMLAFAAIYFLARIAAWQGIQLAPLSRFGRSSLFIYWIHVELVYGYASWPLHGRLPIWGTAIGVVVFSVLMYKALDVRDRAVRWFNTRGAAGQAPAALDFTS
jgi:uncharacterized membrane protein